MDTEYHALLKLKRNPHYKMNAEQIAKLAEYEQTPTVMFGMVDTHENTFKQHNVKVKKIRSK